MSGKEVEKTVYLGTFAHSKSLKELEIAHDAAIFVDESGKIIAVERGVADGESARIFFPKLNWTESQENPIQIVKSKDEQFFFPGFIGTISPPPLPPAALLEPQLTNPPDTHIHASQYPNAGIFGKSTLLDWLNTYTFPMESSLSALPTARRVYARVIARTLSHGTTTAAYYATISVPATNLLADLCLAAGQRALIGRCCMDSLAPDYYRDAGPEESIAGTKAAIAHIASIDPTHAIVKPIITPRFAPSCSSQLLTGLGKLQKETGLPVQTHISENKREIDLVAQLFPESKSYAEVYDSHGLLGPKTVLAHAVHITDEERALIRERGAGISHCPVSNAALSSGMAAVRTWLDDGISVGLGTDVSGGYSPSVLEAVRQALMCSRNLAMGEAGEEAERRKLSVEEALYLGTLGGAKVVGMEGKVGAFEVGMEWDAQLVGMEGVGLEGGFEGADGGPVDVFGWESWEDKLAKWVFNGDDRNTLAVWVRGRLVHQRRS
jgi:guanine deaminase